MHRAAELAVKEINAHGGVRGQSMALRAIDDSGRPDVAIRIAQSFADDPSVVAVIGHLTSGASLAAGRVYGEARRPIAMISPSASSPDLSGVSPYVFRICPSDLSHGAQLARFARQTLGARRVGVIYIDDDYGRGLRLSFAAEFRRLGGEVVEEDPMLSATSSLEPYLSRLRKAGGIDALMLATERAGAELALREMELSTFLGQQQPTRELPPAIASQGLSPTHLRRRDGCEPRPLEDERTLRRRTQPQIPIEIRRRRLRIGRSCAGWPASGRQHPHRHSDFAAYWCSEVIPGVRSTSPLGLKCTS